MRESINDFKTQIRSDILKMKENACQSIDNVCMKLLSGIREKEINEIDTSLTTFYADIQGSIN